MKKFIILMLIFAYCQLLTVNCFAQDPQLTQFYAAPLYLNPAFTGTNIKTRFIANARIQWLGLSGSYNTYLFSYDQNLSNYNSGAGVSFITDKAGGGSIVSNGVNILYAYKLSLSKKITIRPGIQLGYNFLKFDLNELTFGDQLDEFGNSANPTSETISNTKTGYFDVSTGVLLYSSKFWFGISSHHLNMPDQSFTNDATSRLPVKISVHAGAVIPVKSELFGDKVMNIAPSILYKKQAKFAQLDIGSLFHYTPVVLGFWYRGEPFKRSENGFTDNDAVIVLIGYKQKEFSFGYSYDYTISKMRGFTKGAHEISMAYDFDYNILKPKSKGEFPTAH